MATHPEDEKQRQCQQERPQALLLEAIESGPAEAISPEQWEAIRREGRERLHDPIEINGGRGAPSSARR